MRTLAYVASVFLGLVAALVAAGQLGLLKGQAPSDLGVHKGLLKPPSNSPNSVSSQAALYPDHPQHAYATVAPFAFTGSGAAAMDTLAKLLQSTERCQVVTQAPDYVYAQCSTALLRFTDDVEFWLDDKAGLIHVRSASRLGRSDLGANRARVEKIRAQFVQN